MIREDTCCSMLCQNSDLRLAQSFSSAIYWGPISVTVQTALPQNVQEFWFYFSLSSDQKMYINMHYMIYRLSVLFWAEKART